MRAICGNAREGRAALHGMGGWCIRGTGDRENRCFVLAVEFGPGGREGPAKTCTSGADFQGVVG